MAHKVKIVGLEKLQQGLIRRSNLDAAKITVAENGAEMQTKAQQNAKFKGHYEWQKGKGLVFVEPTGTLRRSIALELKNSGKTAVVEPTEHYGAYVELGTRHMDAQPFLRPAFNAQKGKFKSDLKKLVK